MKIQCPHCACSREMDEAAIPDGDLLARCPSCGRKFRFSKRDFARKNESDNVGSTPGHEDAASNFGQGETAVPNKTDAEGRITRDDASDHKETVSPVTDANSSMPQPDVRRADDTEESQRWAGRDTDGDEERWSFNPWECARSFHDYPLALYQTCLRVMFAAPRFFSEFAPGPVLRALSFFLVVVLLQTFIEQIWTMLFVNYIMPPGETTDPEVKQLIEILQSGTSNMPTLILLNLAIRSLKLYFIASILCLTWRLVCGPRVDFSVVLQVICYAEAPLMLCVIPAIGTIVGYVWSIAVTVIGCRAALRLSWGQTILGVLPLALLTLFLFTRIFVPLG